MTAIAFSQFRKRLDEFFTQAEDEVVYITRADGHDRVLISKQEYESLLETAHLLSTAANANRLTAAMADIEVEIARRANVSCRRSACASAAGAAVIATGSSYTHSDCASALAWVMLRPCPPAARSIAHALCGW